MPFLGRRELLGRGFRSWALERPAVVDVVNRRVTNLSRHSQTTQEAPARPSLGLSLYVATLTAWRGPL